MDLQTFNTIILIIYTISLSAAGFALWIKWVQDNQDRKMDELIRYYEKIEKQLARIEEVLDKLTKNKDPFGR